MCMITNCYANNQLPGKHQDTPKGGEEETVTVTNKKTNRAILKKTMIWFKDSTQTFVSHNNSNAAKLLSHSPP